MRVNNRYVSFYYENDNDMGAIEIDPEKTALLVVDMQHVFITRPALENPSVLIPVQFQLMVFREEEEAHCSRLLSGLKNDHFHPFSDTGFLQSIHSYSAHEMPAVISDC